MVVYFRFFLGCATKQKRRVGKFGILIWVPISKIVIYGFLIVTVMINSDVCAAQDVLAYYLPP
jgi:hypothetical protein